MGTICILLGIIFFIAFVMGGVFFAPKIMDTIQSLAVTFTNLASVAESPVKVYAIVIGIFGFIGLLICLNLVMHGLTYNKLRKLGKRHHH